MKTKELIFFLTFIFIGFTSCKDNERTEEVDLDEIEMQEEAFEEDLEELRAGDRTVDAVEANPALSTFAVGLNAWNVEDELEEVEGSYTIFAPDNNAYSSIYQSHGKALLETSSDEIIPYHILQNGMSLTDIKEQMQEAEDTLKIATMQGEELKFVIDNGNLALYGAAGEKAVVTDSMQIDNGMVYIIDNVLLPTDVMTKVTITAEK